MESNEYHSLDMVGVLGSIPGAPTTEQPLTEPAQQTGQRVASKPDCTACRYFQETYPSVSDWHPPDGECHFDPPKDDRTWPRVRGDDWCGKHESTTPRVSP